MLGAKNIFPSTWHTSHMIRFIIMAFRFSFAFWKSLRFLSSDIVSDSCNGAFGITARDFLLIFELTFIHSALNRLKNSVESYEILWIVYPFYVICYSSNYSEICMKNIYNFQFSIEIKTIIIDLFHNFFLFIILSRRMIEFNEFKISTFRKKKFKSSLVKHQMHE